MAGRHLHFVLGNCATHWRDIAALDEADVQRQPSRFVGGRNSWIAQTYLRLRAPLVARGWIVTAGPHFVPGSISIAHRDDANRFLGDAAASFLVVVRADRAPVVACDIALVQNRVATRPQERFVPLWPQPGLVPRDARRGERVSTLAYHGRHAPGWFGDPALGRALVRRGIGFEVRRRLWHDYSQVDVAIAARDDVPTVLATKPATKLYNAWLAGVPVLAAAEPAYLEQRRSPIDFIEVAGPDDVVRAMDLLRANPRLYAAMARNGRGRAVQFRIEAVRDRWLELLEGEVARVFDERRDALAGRRLWYLAAMARQKALSRVHRARAQLERWRDAAAPALAERAPHHLADVSGQAL